jgi:quinolinate synthase
MAHPECREDVIALADVVCSTTAMLSVPARYPDTKTFVVSTEAGIVHQLRKRYSDREFVVADGCIGCRLHCPYMKVTTLADVRSALANLEFEITVPDDDLVGARRSLERMLAVPRDN